MHLCGDHDVAPVLAPMVERTAVSTIAGSGGRPTAISVARRTTSVTAASTSAIAAWRAASTSAAAAARFSAMPGVDRTDLLGALRFEGRPGGVDLVLGLSTHRGETGLVLGDVGAGRQR